MDFIINLFNEFKTNFNNEEKYRYDLHIIISLFLVLNNVKPGVLLEGGNYSKPDYNNNKEVLTKFSKKNNLKTIVLPEGSIERFLVYNPENKLFKDDSSIITKIKNGDDISMAKALDFGCLDLDFLDNKKLRYGYNFYVGIPSPINIKINFQTYVCTESKRVSQLMLNKKLNEYQSTLKKIDNEIEVTFTENPIYSDLYLYNLLKKFANTGDWKLLNNKNIGDGIANTFGNISFLKSEKMFNELNKKLITKHKWGLIALFAICLNDLCGQVYPVSTEINQEIVYVVDDLESTILKDVQPDSKKNIF